MRNDCENSVKKGAGLEYEQMTSYGRSRRAARRRLTLCSAATAMPFVQLVATNLLRQSKTKWNTDGVALEVSAAFDGGTRERTGTMRFIECCPTLVCPPWLEEPGSQDLDHLMHCRHGHFTVLSPWPLLRLISARLTRLAFACLLCMSSHLGPPPNLPGGHRGVM